MTTLIRISREDAILYLAYLASAFSYLAYRESQKAKNGVRGVRSCVDHLHVDVAEMKESVRNDGKGPSLEEPDVQEDADEGNETESVDVDEDWSEDDDQEETVVE